MKNIFLQFVFFISLSAIGQEEIIHDSVVKNLSEIVSKDAIIQFQEKYPTIRCTGGYAVLDSKNLSNAVKKAFRHKKSVVLGPIKNDDTTCSYIKVISREKDYLMRMQYILLHFGPDAEQKADSLCKVIQSGGSIEELAMQFSVDPNRKNVGDIGWFKKNSMIKSVEDELFKRNSGEIFTIYTNEYGWLVVKVIAPAQIRSFIEYVEIEINCNDACIRKGG